MLRFVISAAGLLLSGCQSLNADMPLNEYLSADDVYSPVRITAKTVRAQFRYSATKRVCGLSVIKVYVNSAGELAGTELLRSFPDNKFAQIDLESIQHWRFEPATQGFWTVPVGQWFITTLDHSVKDKSYCKNRDAYIQTVADYRQEFG